MSKEKKKSEMKMKAITLTIKDALEMLDCFRGIARTKLSVFIKFDVGHNINKLKAIEEKFEMVKGNDDVPDFKEYQNGLKELIMKHGKGGRIDKNDSDAINAFESDKVLHEKKYSNTIEAIEQKEKDLKELLKKEITIENMIVLNLDRFPLEMEQDLSPIIELLER